jgi:hypothetical protein
VTTVVPQLRTASRWALTIVAVAAGAASAADPSLEVTLEPRRFGIEDAARLEVRVLEPSGTPVVDLGALTNLQVAGGPSTGTEFSWINGAATRATTFTYVVQGVEVGAASVGPVTVRLGGVELRSQAIAAEVVPGSVVPQQPAGRRSIFPSDPFSDLLQMRQQPTRSARVELRQVLDRNRIVLGQPVVAQVVLDTTAGGVDGFEWIDPPSYPGWWAQRVEPPERIAGEVVEVEGVRYNRFVVARHVLVPLKTGSLTVPAVGARIGFRSASLFAPQQVVERTSSEQVVEVTPRPHAPEGFSGAVGDLRYRAGLQPQRVAFGESAVLSIELEGSGNLPLVEAPALWPTCSECESYPPEEESSVTVDERGIHGSRVWRTTLVPRSAGELELAPVELAVFDPASGAYRKQVLGPMTLVVDPPPATPIPASEPLPEADAGTRPQPTEEPSEGAEKGTPQWLWIVVALTVGLLVGGVVTLLLARRRHVALPPRRNGESPAERARQLQVALERWWLDARARPRGEALEGEMQALRRELEAVRFAPGSADHSQTVSDLEDRVRGLMRRA